jgi:nucleoside phosphorylase
MAQRRLCVQDYAVGWVCALPIELAAAKMMLDEEHQNLPRQDNDTNLYTFGRIGEHNVVIACLPAGQTGTNSAAAVAVEMKLKFKHIQFGLMVGIGGGVPTAESDIRLGDVVISQPHMRHGGVVQYDFGKTEPSGFTRTGFLNTPPTILLHALAKLQANHKIGRNNIPTHLSAVSDLPDFVRNNAGPDYLFESDYKHIEGPTCAQCSKDRLVKRVQRPSQKIDVHYGMIASGNQVIRDGLIRDKLSSELGGALCFEMEAAGLINSFPCLVVRGICDYADSHKNKTWQPYAAATAAACAKEILSIMPPAEVVRTNTINEVIEGTYSTSNFYIYLSKPAMQYRSHALLLSLVLVSANLSDQTSPSRTICFTVPFERDSKFIGREDIITEIDRKFKVQRRVALAGIGGVG